MTKTRITEQDLEKLSHRYQVYFAVFCAEQVFHLIPEQCRVVCLASINTAKKWCIGEASAEECRVAANAAYAAAYAANAAYYATNAAYAANAAYYATNAAADAAAYAAAAHAAEAAKQTIIDAQWEYYDQLLHADRIFEALVLEGKTNV